jgi:predicted unusual protein kinase regulating ubiquinone biosynthesis (AarF/ABC1/UbiB family)
MGEEQRAAFARDMVELFEERCRGYGTGVDVGHVLRGVLGLVRKHRVRIDANFATLVRAVLGRIFPPGGEALADGPRRDGALTLKACAATLVLLASVSACRLSLSGRPKVVNCLCVESLGRAVCPSYNVLDAARPLLRSYRRLRYGKDGAPKGKNPRLADDGGNKACSRERRPPSSPSTATPSFPSRHSRLVLSLMYVRKNLHDHFFFRREARRNKTRTRAQRLLLEMPS